MNSVSKNWGNEMPDEQEFKLVRDATVRQTEQIKTLFQAQASLKEDISNVWKKIWSLFLAMMGAQTIVIGLLVTFLIKVIQE